jgi:biopolymer transport protein ExbD
MLTNADEAVQRVVVDVMDRARMAGVTKMAIAIKPKGLRDEK